LYSPREIKNLEDIKLLFEKFDEDRSGSMEVDELYQMFSQNGINIQQEELLRIFNIVDEDGSGSLSLDEF
jgi:Ca2+-binding EF-hand superfamily protein